MASIMSLPTQNNSNPTATGNRRIRLFKLVVFAMLGTLMFTSKIIMEALPNIHLLGMLTMVYTVAFGMEALIPIYIYVLLNGLYAGFDVWWIPYLYIWTILWGVTMLLPKSINEKWGAVIYPVICSLHGFTYGILYAPAEALLFGLDFQGMIAWIVAGATFDILHGVGNLVAGLLILPLTKLLTRLEKAH